MIKLNNWKNLSKERFVILMFFFICINVLINLSLHKRRKIFGSCHSVDTSCSTIKLKQTRTIRFQASDLLLNEFGHEYEKLSVRENISKLVRHYSTEEIYFSLTTNTKRIRETIHTIKFWATRPGVHCLIIFESKDIESKDNIKSYLTGQGIPCVIKSSNTSRFEERYLELMEQGWHASNKDLNTNIKTIQWFIIGDDDTAWFLDNLLQTLQQYNSSKAIYLGNVSDKLEAVQYHGSYFAFGGGGIILSRPLALLAARYIKDCRRFIHLWGGDEMIGKCITQVLKVNLTRNMHFHQMDHEGDMDGFFESGIEGLVSLHHMFNYWEPFPPEHTINPYETMSLLKIASESFGYDFLKRYVRIDHSTNRTFLLTTGYSFSIFNRTLTYEELMRIEKTWWCCSEFVDQPTRPKEENKLTWYFQAITNPIESAVGGYGAVYENKRKDSVVQYPKIEIILTK